MQFRYLRLKPHFRKQAGNIRAQPRAGVLVLSGDTAHDVTHFFFHAAPLVLGATLQLGFDRVLQVSDYQLGHRSAPILPIISELPVRQAYAGLADTTVAQPPPCVKLTFMNPLRGNWFPTLPQKAMVSASPFCGPGSRKVTMVTGKLLPEVVS